MPQDLPRVGKAEPIGLCVCGAEIYADEANFAVIHSLPLCKPYLALEPDEFLRYVRENRIGGDN